MNGPGHYAEAERIIEGLEDGKADALRAIAADRRPANVAVIQDAIALGFQAAQVHATLALAAATAYPAVKDREPEGAVREDATAWAEVTGA